MKEAEVFCPLCKSNSYINPGIKIYVSPCYHSLCEMCLARLYMQGPNACPQCGVALRRSNYTSQTFEDIAVERECRVRKSVLMHVGRDAEEFASEIEYNDYLERVEEIVQEMMKYPNTKEMSRRFAELKEAEPILRGQGAEKSEKRKGAEPEQKKHRPEDAAQGQIDPFSGLRLEEVPFRTKQGLVLLPPEAISLKLSRDRIAKEFSELVSAVLEKAALSLLVKEI